MNIRVPPSLRRLTGSQYVTLAAGSMTISDLVDRLDAEYPGFREHVCATDGRFKRHLHVFINGVDSRNLQNEQTIVQGDDQIMIVPAMAGGSIAALPGSK